MKRVFYAVSALFVCLSMSAQINTVTQMDKKVKQYDAVFFEVALTGEWENPYLQEEAALDMILTSPSGKELVLPCFYKSGESGSESIWEARFTPQEKGKYTYFFRYTEDGNTVSESEPEKFKARRGKGQGILHVRDNWTLVYDNGDPFRGVGINLCWESRTNDDSKFFSDLHEQHDRFNYDVMLPDFAENGGNFTRMWMCSWNFPIDRQDRFNNHRYTATEEYMNPSAVERLDHVVNLAEDLDIKIMLCMGQGNVRADREFFNSPEAKTRYRNYLRYIVARWGYSPAIGMWEFFNEIDNIQHRDRNGVIPAEEIVAWHDEMSVYLKDIDPFQHIRTTSISHRDLNGLNDVENIDINQKHIYNATHVVPGTIDSYSERHGKPYIIGEVGFEWDWSKNFNDFADGMIMDFRRAFWYGLFNQTSVTPMTWWWEWFDEHGTIPYMKNARLISDMMLKSGKGEFKKFETARDGKAEAYSVRCGNRTYVYVYNGNEDVLDQISVEIGKAGKVKVSVLDTENVKLGNAVTMKSDGTLNFEGLGLNKWEEKIFVIK
ncbi:MAG: DUF5060 domain-containing protein [Bacteroidales bacterium]|nr:DUF5060 domain-containing protein [Bacteroidales bacterium]